LLSFAIVYFSESRFFNGLQAIQIKKSFHSSLPLQIFALAFRLTPSQVAARRELGMSSRNRYSIDSDFLKAIVVVISLLLRSRRSRVELAMRRLTVSLRAA
jgi:hypothetical protein